MKRVLSVLLMFTVFFTVCGAFASDIETVDLKGGPEHSQSVLIPVENYGKYIHFKSLSSLGGSSKGEQWFKLIAPMDGTYVITYRGIHKDFGGGVMDTLLLGVRSDDLGGWADPNGLKITDDRQTVTTKARKDEEVIIEFVDSVFLDRVVEITICFDGYHVEETCNKTISYADCLNDGFRAKSECVICGTPIQTELIPALGHEKDSKLTTIKEPTCTESGLEGHMCKRCGEIIDMNEMKPLGHTEGKAYVVREATCISGRLTEYRCERCGEVLSTEESAVTEHKPGKFEPYKQATCTTDGLQAQYCTVCGELLKTSPIPALGHTPGKWEVIREATEDSEGLIEQKCVNCGEILQTQTIEPTGKK